MELREDGFLLKYHQFETETDWNDTSNVHIQLHSLS